MSKISPLSRCLRTNNTQIRRFLDSSLYNLLQSALNFCEITEVLKLSGDLGPSGGNSGLCRVTDGDTDKILDLVLTLSCLSFSERGFNICSLVAVGVTTGDVMVEVELLLSG